MKIMKHLLALVIAFGCLGSGNQLKAITIGDSHELGFVNFGIPSGDADRTKYVNHLIDMSLGSTDMADGQTYFRSSNSFGSLPDAVWAANGTGTSIDLGSGYLYLFAKYDGPNFGSEVWYVGDLSGTITIPAFGSGSKYGLSGWTLFNPIPRQQVPEGGNAIALLGLGLICMVILRNRLQRA